MGGFFAVPQGTRNFGKVIVTKEFLDKMRLNMHSGFDGLVCVMFSVASGAVERL
jgi:hypothetical protein